MSFSLLIEDQGLVLSASWSHLILISLCCLRLCHSFQSCALSFSLLLTFLAFFSFLLEAGIIKNCTYHSLNTMCQIFHTNYLLKTTQNIGIFIIHFFINHFINHSREGGSSLVAQLVKNLPAMQETTLPFLGQEDSLEEG